MARSLARRAAMQLLYERLSGGEADQESLDMVYEQLSEEGEKPQRVNLTPEDRAYICLLYTSPSPRDRSKSRLPSSA